MNSRRVTARSNPGPKSPSVLGTLHAAGVPLGVVTNCSETLGRLAASRIPVPFSVIVTAERAGCYKPEPQPYRLALDELGVVAERCLFVAGSAYDLFGTARVGLPTWWHDRIGMTAPPDAPAPIAHHRTLAPLLVHALSRCAARMHTNDASADIYPQPYPCSSMCIHGSIFSPGAMDPNWNKQLSYAPTNIHVVIPAAVIPAKAGTQMRAWSPLSRG